MIQGGMTTGVDDGGIIADAERTPPALHSVRTRGHRRGPVPAMRTRGRTATSTLYRDVGEVLAQLPRVASALRGPGRGNTRDRRQPMRATGRTRARYRHRSHHAAP